MMNVVEDEGHSSVHALINNPNYENNVPGVALVVGVDDRGTQKTDKDNTEIKFYVMA